MTNDNLSTPTLAQVAPIVRGLLADPTDNEDMPYQPAIFKSFTNEQILDFSVSPDEVELPETLNRPEDPPPMWVSLQGVDPAETLRSSLTEYEKHHGTRPTVVIIPGTGAFYREQQTAEGSLAQKIALVTGAAGAIGHGICQGLLEQGCYVAATDLPGERLDKLVAEFAHTDRIIGIPLDVTDRASVEQGFAHLLESWGGVDIVVVNAGIALVSPLVEMKLADFQRVERVNVEGTLLSIAEAGRILTTQGIGGDIVLVSTKNVFAPGASFGAYSATKAASHQLARIASLELAPLGIRVNMVAPDAVFSGGDFKSGLWAEVGPDRMRARGLDEAGLEEYYRNRNLLKAKVTARHVANAVLFFVTHQTPTTGATIPVDGGLPDSTPR